MGLIRLLAFVACSMGLPQSGSQEHQGILYQTPIGWQESTDDDAKIFSPKGLKEAEVLAIILTPATASSTETNRKQFDLTVAAANTGATLLASEEVNERIAGTVSMLVQAQSLESKELGKHSRLYTMLFVAKRKTFVMVVSNRDALLEKYGVEIMKFISSLSFKPVSETVTSTETDRSAPKPGKIPTGNTPDAYMGSAGFLPSGRGVPIPPSELVNGKPQGLWWWLQLDSHSKLHPTAHIYLPNGIFASNPRLGSGNLYDLEGQKAQRGSTGLGTFAISGGQMHQIHNGFEKRVPYVSGSDAYGKFFKIDGTIFRPLQKATQKAILGKWQAISVVRSQYEFLPDGTYRSGQIVDTGDWVGGSTASGAYTIEGWLLMLQPSEGPPQINLIGFDRSSLMIGTSFHTLRK